MIDPPAGIYQTPLSEMLSGHHIRLQVQKSDPKILLV
jgi:hypothetical protein